MEVRINTAHHDRRASRHHSKAVDELKRMIFKQNEVIERLKQSKIDKASNVEDYCPKSGSSVRKLLSENNQLKERAKKYKRERDELIRTSQVLEEYVYVFKQERDQLLREIKMVRSEFDSIKRKRTGSLTSTSDFDENSPENVKTMKRYKYRSAINPHCALCGKLEEKLIRQKAENLERGEIIKELKAKVKKNVSVYRRNLENVGQEVSAFCSEFVEQAAQVETLKNNLSAMNVSKKEH